VSQKLRANAPEGRTTDLTSVVLFEEGVCGCERTAFKIRSIMYRPKNQDDKASDNRTKEEIRNDSIQEIDEYVKSKEEKIREDVNEGAARNRGDRGIKIRRVACLYRSVNI
jgi:hypothetical protein